MITLAPSPLVFDCAYARLKDYLIAATGLAYYRDRDDDLTQHIGGRMVELGLQDCLTYFNLLKDGDRGAAELDKLIEQLTIGETFFFRHRELFDALHDAVLPDIIERNQATRRLRIWSAGCSFGAEPYSISILLKRDFGHLLEGWDVSIVGTDINRGFLDRAREGCFEDWAFRGVPETIKNQCFSRVGRTWAVAEPYRKGVSFQYHNLVDHPFPSLVQNLLGFDLILCRNVMIYFGQDIIRRVVKGFHHSLVNGGWLLVGYAEPNVEMFRDFQTITKDGAVLYQKYAPADDYIRPDIVCEQIIPRPNNDPNIAFAPSSGGISVEPETQLLTLRANSELSAQPAVAIDLDLIRSLSDEGNLDLALTCCQQLLASDRLNATTHFYYALLLDQTGRHEEAERFLRRTVYLDRRYILAHYYLGLMAQRNERRQVALRSFSNVLDLLGRRPPDERLSDSDGLTVRGLEKQTQMHLAALRTVARATRTRKATIALGVATS